MLSMKKQLAILTAMMATTLAFGQTVAPSPPPRPTATAPAKNGGGAAVQPTPPSRTDKKPGVAETGGKPEAMAPSGGGSNPIVLPNLPRQAEGGGSVFEDIAPPPAVDVQVDNSVRPIIEFNEAPFANVVRLLSKQAGISFLEPNLVDEPALTITLRNTTPLEAFKTICEFRGFRVRNTGGVYTLSRPDMAGAEALIVKKYRLSHLDPAWVLQEIANLLGITLTAPAENINTLPAPQQPDIGSGGGSGGSGGSSGNSFGGGVPTQPRWLPSLPFDSPASTGGIRAEFAGGTTMPSAVWIDRRDNGIVVRASKDEHSMVEEYISENDHPEPLIVIDCRIIELTDDSTSNVGMDWSKAFEGGMTFSLDPAFRTAASGMFNWSKALEFFFFPMGAIVDWPDAEATFRAWEKENKAHAISTPRVVTKTGVPVSIVSVIQEPIETYAAGLGTTGNVNNNILNSGTQTFTYGVTMDVVPRLLADNFVDLNINPIVSQKIGEKPVGSKADGTAQTLPIISKRNATTTVRVQSGQTVIIGGLMSLDDSVENTGVPPFNKIPIIGNLLYGDTRTKNKKTNLLIFVTPRVIAPDRVPTPQMGAQEQNAYNSSLRLDPPYRSTPVRMDKSLNGTENPPVEMLPRVEKAEPSRKGTRGKFRWPWQKK